MKAKKKMASSKKILIASLLVGVILIGSIITLVAVFAAQTQNISSNVSVSYTVDGVAVKTSATYAAVPKEGSVTKLPMSGDDGAELIFNVPDEETTKNLDAEEIKLSSSTRKVVFEYKFTNIADSAFTISLTDEPMPNNMNVYYRVSATEIAASEYQDATTFTDTTRVMTQAVVEKDRSVYIYVVAELDDDKKSASYDGTIEWTMLYVAPETLVEINLDNDNDGTADGSMKIIPNVAMPLVYDKPTSGSGTFRGYSTSEIGGTQYVNADGTSANVANLTNGATLYAQYDENPFVIEETTIVGLNQGGKSQTNLVIPNNITEIAEGAFANNTVVETISYEGADSGTEGYADGDASQLTKIGANAFANCTNLKEISLPISLTTIADGIFAGCNAIESLRMPAVIPVLDTNLMASGFAKLFTPSGETYAQSNVPAIKNVTIDGGITLAMGAIAFSAIENLTIKNVTTIDQIAVAISTITNLTIENVTEILSQSFNTSTINTINLLDEDVTIAGDAFAEVMKVCQVKNLHPTYTFSEEIYAIENPEIITNAEESFEGEVENTGKYIIYKLGEDKTIISPSDYSYFNMFMYQQASLITTADDIPQDVTSIGNNAFSGCLGLTSVSIPEGVTSIGSFAFSGCSGLTSVTFADNSQLTRVERHAFSGCNSLTSINIPEGVTSIGNNAFYTCSGLTSINIPEGVTSIGQSAFAYCSSLTSITIPSSVTSLGTTPLASCTKLESLEFPYIFGDGTSSVNGFSKLFGSNSAIPSTLTTVVINGGTSIGNYAFSSCSSLNSVSIPSSVISIGDYAFSSCTSLTSVSIPSSVTSIGTSAFSYCRNLVQVRNLSGQTMQGYTAPSYAEVKTDDSPFTTTLEIGSKYAIFIGTDEVKRLLTATDRSITTANEIPSDVTVINDRAFQNCISLTSVNIPKGVISIGELAFSDCTALTEINWNAKKLSSELTYTSGIFSNAGTKGSGITLNIGEEVEEIPANLFYCFYRPIITSVKIAENSKLTSIGDNAFYECYSLTSINIPEGVTSIGDYAFYDCRSLTYNIYDNAKYLGNSKNPYMVLMEASDIYIGSCEINANTKIIYEEAFSECSWLTSITIPNSVTCIGRFAFGGCTALTEINWNAKKLSSALSSSNYIFSNAGTKGSGIKVNIGEEVEEIPAYLFYQSSSSFRPNITSVVLPEGSTWVRSTSNTDLSAAVPVTESAATIATNLKDSWSSYYLIRTDK